MLANLLTLIVIGTCDDYPDATEISTRINAMIDNDTPISSLMLANAAAMLDESLTKKRAELGITV